MTRPDPPEGYVWREDFEALTKLIGDQAGAILNAAMTRVVARIEREGLPLPLGEEMAQTLLCEEFDRARAELVSMWSNCSRIPSRHQ
jgi:hypothetical protein